MQFQLSLQTRLKIHISGLRNGVTELNKEASSAIAPRPSHGRTQIDRNNVRLAYPLIRWLVIASRKRSATAGTQQNKCRTIVIPRFVNTSVSQHLRSTPSDRSFSIGRGNRLPENTENVFRGCLHLTVLFPLFHFR